MDRVDPSLLNLEGLNLSIFQLLDKENPGCEKEYSKELDDTGNWLKKKKRSKGQMSDSDDSFV